MFLVAVALFVLGSAALCLGAAKLAFVTYLIALIFVEPLPPPDDPAGGHRP